VRAVALSLGGTKVRCASVFEGGGCRGLPAVSWRDRFGLRADRPEDGDRLVDGMAGMAWEEWLRWEGEPVEIGLATKGPLKRVGEDLILGPGHRTENMPFLDFPIECRLRESLVRRAPAGLCDAARRVALLVLHDGAACATGEASSGGTCPGARDLSALILGTGVGVGIRRDGAPWSGGGSPKTSVIGSFGRHAVFCCNPGGGLRYEWRGFPEGSTRAVLRADECYGSDRLSGPALAELLACEAAADPAWLLAMGFAGAARDEIDRLARRERRDEMKDLEARLLAGLTAAARKGHESSRRKLAAIGAELGWALLAYAKAFPGEAFARRVVLVSTVAERLGVGVPGETTDDLLLECAQRVVSGEAVAVMRSACPDRELLAFTPAGGKSD